MIREFLSGLNEPEKLKEKLGLCMTARGTPENFFGSLRDPERAKLTRIRGNRKRKAIK